MTEIAELKEMMVKQQQQLNELSERFMSLQQPFRRNLFSCNGPVVCRWCQQPGHFTSSCDNERVVSQVHQLASYYRRFVEGFARLSAPLDRLVAALGGKHKKGTGQVIGAAWTEECEEGFKNLKASLTTAPVLAYADFSQPFILEIDASHRGLGAVLSQDQGGRIRPVAYASRALSLSERNISNYSSMKLEFLALKWAVTEKFQEYLLGHKCVVWTDNNPLSYLNTAKLGATEQRWAAQLSAFDFTIHYRSGRINVNVDSLSRQVHSTDDSSRLESLLPGTSLSESLQQHPDLRPTEVTQMATSVLPTYSTDYLVSLQQQDSVIGTFLRFWR